MSKQRIIRRIALGSMIAFSVLAVVIVGLFSTMVTGDLATDYFVLALLWIAWGAVHSGMCSLTATEFLKRRAGTFYRFYRLFYNLVAVATIVPVILYAHSIEDDSLFRWEGSLVALQVFLLALAGLVWLAGARHYDMLHFLGFRQIKTGASHNVLTETGNFETRGILGATRHPWYLAALIFIWVHCSSITAATLVTNVLLTVYVVVGVILEERKLLLEFGDEYREYQRKVSALFPSKWLKMRIPRVYVVFPHLEESQDDAPVL